MTEKKTIELKRTYDAPVSVMFDAIKDGQLFRSTGVKFNSFKHDFRVGGEYSLEWTSKTEGACTGRYLEIEPNKQVKFTWNSRGCESSPTSETIVTVTFKERGQKCEMVLTHEGLDAGFCYDDHLKGWTFTYDDLEKEIARLTSVS